MIAPMFVAMRRSSLLVPALLAVSSLALRGEAQEAGADPSFIGGSESAETILAGMSARAPRRLRQVGTSSITLRADLGEGLESAFKPRTRTHPRGWMAEIAAYRIARALGMDNVPPVIGRSMPRAVMQQRFDSEHPEDWEPIRETILWDAPGVARGAAIYWIPRMRSSDLASAAGLERAAPWLAQSGEVPPDRSSVARDLSTLLAFDYLIGNWDRFSGGNVSTDATGTRLFVRDHNVAFIEPLQGDRYARVRAGLERVQRFSRGFVERLRALDEAALRAALAEDPEGRERPLLDDAQIGGVLARRRALLSYVAAVVELHGAERVLVWP